MARRITLVHDMSLGSLRDTGEGIDLRYNKGADAFLQYGWIGDLSGI